MHRIIRPFRRNGLVFAAMRMHKNEMARNKTSRQPHPSEYAHTQNGMLPAIVDRRRHFGCAFESMPQKKATIDFYLRHFIVLFSECSGSA